MGFWYRYQHCSAKRRLSFLDPPSANFQDQGAGVSAPFFSWEVATPEAPIDGGRKRSSGPDQPPAASTTMATVLPRECGSHPAAIADVMAFATRAVAICEGFSCGAP